MSNLTQAQAAALYLLRARIDPKHPAHSAGEDVSAALVAANAHCYMETWVYPLLDLLEKGEQWCGQGKTYALEAAQAKARVE